MNRSIKSLDWTLIILYVLIAGFGIVNIYSVSEASGEKQLMWVVIALVISFILFFIRSFVLESFAPFIYVIGMILLAGVLIFGTERGGAKAWYVLGPISFQPVEAAKISVAIMLATYCNSSQFNSRNLSSLAKASAIILFPIGLIILQPDVGSILVFTAFIVALVREGLPGIIFIIGFYFALLFLVAINISFLYTFMGITISFIVLIFLFTLYFRRRNFSREDKINIKEIIVLILVYLASVTFIFFSPTIFEHLPKHQKDRIMVLFEGEKKYSKTAGYNLLYSKSAIANGEIFGQGYKQGPVTIGRFVPEQRTDFIFCAVGEEWGFVGSSLLLIFYAIFIGRIYFLAENMKSTFSRVFGYSVGSILLIHFIINIGMVLGLFPTVGIPLPLFSYGGSSLLAFTILIAIFIKLKFEDNQSLI